MRWLVWEGIREWWATDLPEWVSCDAAPAERAAPFLQTIHQSVFGTAKQAKLASVAQVACPLSWAPEVHSFCCSHVFPPDYDMDAPPEELNTREYHGKIVDDKVVERLLAKGGIRLAAVLNTILGSPQDTAQYGLVSTSFLEDTEPAQGAWRAWRRW